MTLAKRVREAFYECKVPTDAGIILGLSGGSDSVAALYALREVCGAQGLAAVHINHGIRKDTSRRDEEFCRGLCDALGVTLFVERYDIPALSDAEGEGIEECARKYRYRAFEKYASLRRARVIVTAHNASDSAESMIFNLCRGTGLRGLRGIPQIRAMGEYTVFRPILSETKEDILAYLSALGAEYVTDETNLCIDYTRNYIRHEIIPRLSHVNPAFITNISNTQRIIGEAGDYIKHAADDFLESTAGEIAIGDFLSLPSAVGAQVLFSLCPDVLNAGHIGIIRGFLPTAQSGKRLSLPQGYELLVSGESFLIKKRTGGGAFCMPLQEGETQLEGQSIIVFMRKGKEAEDAVQYYKNIYKSVKYTVINCDTISGNLYIRNRMPKDSYVRDNMTRSLKKLLAAKEIPAYLRQSYPVICDDEGIICMPGLPPRDGSDGRYSDNKMIIGTVFTQ